MVLLWKYNEQDFTIKCACYDVTKNALEMILLWKCMKNNFAIKIHWKWFCYKSALEINF